MGLGLGIRVEGCNFMVEVYNLDFGMLHTWGTYCVWVSRDIIAFQRNPVENCEICIQGLEFKNLALKFAARPN